MAYHHAKAGVCYAGATLSGLINKPMNLLTGSDLSSPVRSAPFRISTNLDGGPSECTFVVNHPPPALWQDVHFRYGPAGDDLLWAGTVTDVNAIIQGDKPDVDAVQWSVRAVDWTWLLNRFAVVNTAFYTASVNVIARRIIDTFTNGGFRLGYCPQSLGVIDEFRVQDKQVSEALTQLAKAANAYVRIRPNRKIDIARTFPDGNPITLDDTTPIRFRGYEASGSMVATHVTVKGRGSTTSTFVPAGATTIAVDDCAPYSAAGGLAWADDLNIAYTGVSASVGPGSLTGVTGVSRRLEQRTQVRVRAVEQDASAQSALAAALGSGRSGVASVVFADERMSEAEARGFAASYLAFYKQPIPAVSFEIDDVRYRDVGKLMTATMTTPFVINGDFRVQSVDITYDNDVQVSDLLPRLKIGVSARLGRRADILDVLVQRT